MTRDEIAVKVDSIVDQQIDGIFVDLDKLLDDNPETVQKILQALAQWDLSDAYHEWISSDD